MLKKYVKTPVQYTAFWGSFQGRRRLTSGVFSARTDDTDIVL